MEAYGNVKMSIYVCQRLGLGGCIRVFVGVRGEREIEREREREEEELCNVMCEFI